MDIRAQQAREHHARSLEKEDEAGREREMRDRLIRQLREDDPQAWSYKALARAVGCSPELIAYIVKQPALLSAHAKTPPCRHSPGRE